jgi:hypothetical protein
MYNKNLGISEEDIANCNDLDQLQDWLHKVEGDIAKMSNNIDRAKAHFFDTGEYADPVWYANTVAAKRIQHVMKAILHTRIANVKSKLPKSDFPNTFMDVARQRLNKDAFESILKEAKAVYENL